MDGLVWQRIQEPEHAVVRRIDVIQIVLKEKSGDRRNKFWLETIRNNSKICNLTEENINCAEQRQMIDSVDPNLGQKALMMISCVARKFGWGGHQLGMQVGSIRFDSDFDFYMYIIFTCQNIMLLK